MITWMPQAVKEAAQDEGGHGVHPHGDGIKQGDPARREARAVLPK